MTLFGQEHVERYLETDGEVGHDWKEGAPVLILTTTGRRSGGERRTPLIYGMHGDDPVVVASKGGAPAPPSWFLNLEANPDALVQIRGDRFPVRARVATPEEKPDLWEHMNEIWPRYESYQRKTDREIPVIVLEPAA